jgi:hypothetical protein
MTIIRWQRNKPFKSFENLTLRKKRSISMHKLLLLQQIVIK